MKLIKLTPLFLTFNIIIITSFKLNIFISQYAVAFNIFNSKFCHCFCKSSIVPFINRKVHTETIRIITFSQFISFNTPINSSWSLFNIKINITMKIITKRIIIIFLHIQTSCFYHFIWKVKLISNNTFQHYITENNIHFPQKFIFK